MQTTVNIMIRMKIVQQQRLLRGIKELFYSNLLVVTDKNGNNNGNKINLLNNNANNQKSSKNASLRMNLLVVIL